LAAELTDREALPRPIWHDVQAETWSAVADTRRRVRDLAGAESAFAEAERHLLAGSGTLMVRAELLVSKASLGCDLGRFEPGQRAIDQALSILRAGARPAEIARALVAKGRLHLEHRRPEDALRFFAEALELAEGSTDRGLVLAAHHNCSAALCELGRYDEARGPLAVASSAVTLLARPLGTARLRWLEGRCAAGAGDSSSAEACLLQALDGFRDRGERLSAARVGLELARLYGRQRRLGRLSRLGWPILPIFRQGRAAWRSRPITDRSW
jgi:tetratricopeptide (TPR) repeat protein